MRMYLRLLALVLVGVAALVVVAIPLIVINFTVDQDDPFTAKYRQIREWASYREAALLLGPPDRQRHFGLFGDSHYVWKSEDGMRSIHVTVSPIAGQISGKCLGTRNGAVLLSEAWNLSWPPPTKPWWERLLTTLGLR
jgi:hypothetical protein